MVLIDVHPLLRNDLDALYKRDVAAKQVVLRFFRSLLDRGYRHFIVDLEQPSDLWVLHLLSGYQISTRNAFSYSVGIRQYEEDACDWIETSPCDWNGILRRAKRVLTRRREWYEGRYCVERLYVSTGEKWYDACDRCDAPRGRHRYAVFTRPRSMQEKLSEVFVRQYPALLAVAFQLTRSEDDALDLMQDLAETIARNDRPADSVEYPMAFFRTCLRHAQINAHKRAEREVPSEPDTFSQLPAAESVEQDVVGSAAMEWLKKELADYPEEMREAFYLYFFDGYSLEEVAKRLNINKNTLSQRFVRIRQRLVKKASDQSLFFTLMVLYLLKMR